MIDISPAQAASRITTLLKTADSQTLEFKCMPGKMVGKALETICAFSNTEGCVPRPAAYHIRKRKAVKNPFESIRCNHHG